MTDREIELEQEHVTGLYARVDALRERALAGSEDADAAAVRRAEVERLAAVEHGLCFGRLDMADGRRVHIGRMGLFEGDEALLVDWRAPVAKPFYTATAAVPEGVRRRRHITTRGREVVALDDELLGSGGDGDVLVGEAALLAAVTAERTGRMPDVVMTLRAEQDRIIRDENRGVLVVQGGPGTGKTAVALHRVAYLLYRHQHLRGRGVLVVGPSRVFLEYIGQVLPGLGENSVVTSTVVGLRPDLVVDRVDPPEVAEAKGRIGMAARLAAAVRERVVVPDHAVAVEFEGQVLEVTPAEWEAAVGKGKASGLPHNQGRLVFEREVVEVLAGRLVEGMEGVVLDDGGEALDGGDADGRLSAADLRGLAAAGVVVGEDLGPRALLDEVDRGLLRDSLLADGGLREVLEGVWPVLSAAEVVGGGGAWSGDSGSEASWSAADVALVDEVEALIGGGRVVFGHVVVDEAQELSAMEWRMVMRRCPSRFMTVVGDLEQTGSVSGASSWGEVLGPFVGKRFEVAGLSVNYRTPVEVMEVAGAVLAAHREGVVVPRSVRVGGEVPWRVLVERGEVVGWVGRFDGAVVASDGVVEELCRGLPGRVVLTAREAKGLEFDSVLVVDPVGILGGRTGVSDLYVAMTRAVRRLGVVCVGEVPGELMGMVEFGG
ncbi:HelD family protein [Umezawaea tangerina]|uniref:DNA helicase IV n=1 Tax=Umezawaea tangerina TaxID=84725 RepID=A0A2T0SMA3_9PSEU|nr:helicase [Umezawaea tangerina]PRY34542.1 DNA helicase IV [Umezawaea tangerina]